jgi:hypothetical protein
MGTSFMVRGMCQRILVLLRLVAFRIVLEI